MYKQIKSFIEEKKEKSIISMWEQSSYLVDGNINIDLGLKQMFSHQNNLFASQHENL